MEGEVTSGTQAAETQAPPQAAPATGAGKAGREGVTVEVLLEKKSELERDLHKERQAIAGLRAENAKLAGELGVHRTSEAKRGFLAEAVKALPEGLGVDMGELEAHVNDLSPGENLQASIERAVKLAAKPTASAGQGGSFSRPSSQGTAPQEGAAGTSTAPDPKKMTGADWTKLYKEDRDAYEQIRGQMTALESSVSVPRPASART